MLAWFQIVDCFKRTDKSLQDADNDNFENYVKEKLVRACEGFEGSRYLHLCLVVVFGQITR